MHLPMLQTTRYRVLPRETCIAQARTISGCDQFGDQEPAGERRCRWQGEADPNTRLSATSQPSNSPSYDYDVAKQSGEYVLSMPKIGPSVLRSVQRLTQKIAIFGNILLDHKAHSVSSRRTTHQRYAAAHVFVLALLKTRNRLKCQAKCQGAITLRRVWIRRCIQAYDLSAGGQSIIRSDTHHWNDFN
ncbi:hypothetical protein M441DRAFT_43735 [Trichoderma asperellum CBS 433.97]|uniref:Uncharacterized protein n=1 Tax=Trichoderma asperellum (strain ATCC 204424 / CBS 433.97 / NBRC 101777) TaxID=1042311 RepID=A0A2T3ZLQ3_TRIA4|nr:hypothetical protein M441DRAFT_43735 [Trichoderma asperellum CBS 433.97]PTB45734.1 hypothetical protein M441DRAFT_43735 [Trichoderma asperellum CBS 433.97]